MALNEYLFGMKRVVGRWQMCYTELFHLALLFDKTEFSVIMEIVELCLRTENVVKTSGAHYSVFN